MPRDHWVAACGNIVGKVRNDGVVIGNFDIPLKKSKEVDCLQGCFMSFRREVLQESGGFDENYDSFFRGDDTDVCFAAKKHGYKLIYEPKAIVWHKALGKHYYSTEKWVYYYIRGCTYFYFKNVFPRAKRYLPWFFKGLFFPPKDYAEKSSIRIRLVPSLPLTILRGVIDGMLPRFRKMFYKTKTFETLFL
jgi:GT2 family glycosyltransferase